MKKRIAVIIGLVILIAGSLLFYNEYNKKTIYEGLSMSFVEDRVIEYGSEMSGESLIMSYDGELITIPEIDTMTVGEQVLTYNISKDKITKSFDCMIEVTDTKSPVIKIKKDKLTINVDDTINIEDNISSVTDEIDGSLSYKKTIDEQDVGCYTYTSDVNTKKAGTYSVNITATDINGLKTTKSFSVVVKEKEESQTETVSDHLSYNADLTISKNKVIVINAGHQSKGDSSKEANGPGSSVMKAKVTTGATGVSSKVTESQINLDVAKKLKSELESRGYTVYMIRTTQNVNISNKERALIANEYKPGAVISIHCDSISNSSTTGAQTIAIASDNPYCQGLYKASSSLAKNVINAYCKETGLKNRGVSYRNDLTGLNWSTVPSVYIELGFISNKTEDQLLTDSSFQSKCAKGIANGLDEYFK